MKNIWKLLMIALLAFAMIGCPTTKEDDDDDNGTGGSGDLQLGWWSNSNTSNGNVNDPPKMFPDGFKFTTSAGWSGQYISQKSVVATASFEKEIFKLSEGKTFKAIGPINSVDATIDTSDAEHPDASDDNGLYNYFEDN